MYDADAETSRLIQRHVAEYDVLTASSLAEIRRLREARVVSGVLVTGPPEPRTWHRVLEIQEAFRNLPVFLCPLPGQRLADELGVVGYLVKPVMRDQIARSLRRAGRTVHDALVVDDDPDFVELLDRMIHAVSRRVRVRKCYSGAEALASLREQKPDLVLLDLKMSGMDGYSVLDVMRAENWLSGIPVVVVSAQGRQEEMVMTGMLGISRGSGLTVDELMRVFHASVSALNPGAPSTDPEHPVARPG